MTNPKKQRPPTREVEIDREPSQEYDEFVEYEREHRDQDEREYGEVYEDDVEGEAIEDDPDEYERG
jgi:hypothetical protein